MDASNTKISPFILVPSDYIIALNATFYCAQIYSDTATNTPVYNIRAIINPSLGHIDQSILILMTESSSRLLEFQGGSNNRLLFSDTNLVSIGNDRVFDASINLVAELSEEFEEHEYPVQLEVDILLIAFFNGTAQQVTSRGLVYIEIQGEKIII